MAYAFGALGAPATATSSIEMLHFFSFKEENVSHVVSQTVSHISG
jgi:hypothetical protein